MPNTWWMPIQTRNEMLSTGIRSQLGIKVYGHDLATIERAALDIERAIQHVPGTRSAFAERLTGGFYLDIDVDRDAAARHGLRVRDVSEVVESALGGMTIASTVEGRERYPISVRYARDYREDLTALERILVMNEAGAQIPLSQVASINFSTGPDMVRSEAGQISGFVFVDVADRPIVDYVRDARRLVADEVTLPPGVRLEWAGQFQAYERARDRLYLVVPLTLLLVVLLLYFNTGDRSLTGQDAASQDLLLRGRASLPTGHPL
jgi:Cu(I)/Ag(I) efflux system membrane protein CusA/SilA